MDNSNSEAGDVVGELIEKMVEYKKKHRIKLFFRSIRAHIQNLLSEIKWAFQRMFRGWDDRVVWSIDYHIAEMMPIWLEVLKEKNIGVPVIFLEKGDALEQAETKFNDVLDRISMGFSSYNRFTHQLDYDTPEERKMLEENFEEGMSLFVEYFSTLWY